MKKITLILNKINTHIYSSYLIPFSDEKGFLFCEETIKRLNLNDTRIDIKNHCIGGKLLFPQEDPLICACREFYEKTNFECNSTILYQLILKSNYSYVDVSMSIKNDKQYRFYVFDIKTIENVTCRYSLLNFDSEFISNNSFALKSIFFWNDDSHLINTTDILEKFIEQKPSIDEIISDTDRMFSRLSLL